MGILEVHFHDAQFEWTLAPGTDEERSFSVGTGDSPSDHGESNDDSRPSVGGKLRSVGLVAFVVGVAVVFRRLRRNARATDSGGESGSESRLRSRSR